MAGDGFKWREHPDLLQKVQELRTVGKTAREIAEEIGFTQTQVNGLLGAKGWLKNVLPGTTVGLTVHDMDLPDANRIWDRAINEIQPFAEAKQDLRANQRSRLIPAPGMVVLLSDIHFGAAGSDYRSALDVANLIHDTEDCFCLYYGDGLENFVLPKMEGLNRNQPFTHDEALSLHLDWCKRIGPKLLAACPGNHELWSDKMVGWDVVRDHLLRACPDPQYSPLYHKYEIAFELPCGDFAHRFLMRHKVKYTSVFNATHGMQVAWERGDYDFDFIVSGHTHRGTYFHDFHKHGKRRWACLTGTFKQYDPWGEECGFPRTKDSGCGAVVFTPEGGAETFRDVNMAARFLAFLKGHKWV